MFSNLSSLIQIENKKIKESQCEKKIRKMYFPEEKRVGRIV